jgi:phosphatidylinositol glycan class B
VITAKMNFHQKIFSLAIVIYSITAFFSVGYIHADEHYQIIEFAGTLDGSNDVKDLAWEYGAKIRPALQPCTAHFFMRTCELLSITSPYSKALILRLITAIFSLLVLNFFSKSCKRIIHPDYWKLFLILTYFLWFLPFINVRFSSETWSGLLLLLSAGLIIRNHRSSSFYLLLGTILGLSFLFRYQIAFAIVGIMLWLLLVRKEQVSKLLLMSVVLVLISALGVLIDSWFYGQWTISIANLWNYFFIVNENTIDFTASPWYYYFFLIFRYSFFPIGIIILLSVLFGVFKRNKSIIIWIMIPFILGHSIVSHKELRFLFPLVNFIPILIIWALDFMRIKERNSLKNKILNAVLLSVLSINMIMLVIASLKPAGSGRVYLTEQIHNFNTKEQLRVIYAPKCNPYSPWGISTHFYKEPNATFIPLNSFVYNSTDTFKGATTLICTLEDSKKVEIQMLIKKMEFKEVSKSYPDVIFPFLSIYGANTNDILIVYGME